MCQSLITQPCSLNSTPQNPSRCLLTSAKKNPLLLNEINQKAEIHPRVYLVIFRFVPCNRGFDPSDDDHLHSIERDNDLPAHSISAVSWCKCLDKCSPNQAMATLKVACTNPDTANRLLTGRIRVVNHLVTVQKDIRIPIRYVKCQGYGHIQDSCIGVDKCANCTSEFHRSDASDRPPACVSYGPGSQHPSTSLACPVFLKKCNALDECFPENSMPYFPPNNSWTWAAAPTNPPPLEFPLPPPQQANPRQRSLRPAHQTSHFGNERPQQARPSPLQSRQSDNGWPSQRQHQTTLPNAWGSQPKTFSSSASSSHRDPPHQSSSQ